tara:strand:- start:667 stop:873 length:207 start_codon:yes stop_codon:yes gene_type:complete
MKFWIEDGENQEHGFSDLTKAKKRARVLMCRRRKEGDSLPLVQVIAHDNSVSYHFCNAAQGWAEDRNF